MTRPATLCALALLLPTAGCGTLFFPERRGEEHSGRVDPNVVVLDGVGLLFFVVPGLVMFGVDLATGTIYLPDGVDEGEGPFFHDDEPDLLDTATS